MTVVVVVTSLVVVLLPLLLVLLLLAEPQSLAVALPLLPGQLEALLPHLVLS